MIFQRESAPCHPSKLHNAPPPVLLPNRSQPADNVNWVVLPEYGCQAALTAVLLLTGHWLYGGLHAVLLAYHVRQVCSARALGGWLHPLLAR
jgi:hypothetical protein